MCVLNQHAHALKRVKELEAKVTTLVEQNKLLEETILEYQQMLETGWKYPNATYELPSPKGRVPKSNILFANGTLTIASLPSVWVSDLADTNSEDPFFDKGNSVLLVRIQAYAPYRYEDLQVGDICVYDTGDKFIIHRIVKIEVDDKGRKYTFRGDNTAGDDPYIIRDENLKYLMIGVIY